MNDGMTFSVQAYRSVKILVYLAAQREDRPVTITECVEALKDKAHLIRPAAAALSQHGFTTGRGGVSGGIRLLMNPDRIRLSEVILKTSPKIQKNICRFDADDANKCDCYMAEFCTISRLYADAINDAVRSFERWRLSDLLTPDVIRKARDAADTFQAQHSQTG